MWMLEDGLFVKVQDDVYWGYLSISMNLVLYSSHKPSNLPGTFGFPFMETRQKPATYPPTHAVGREYHR